MGDRDLRELARAAAGGDGEAETALLAARVRRGLLPPVVLRLRAYLGEDAARRAYGRPPEPCSVAPEGAAAQALTRLSSAYCMVEHRLFAAEPDLMGREGHELVARETARQLLIEDRQGDQARLPEATTGHRIDLAEFFGPRFDLARRAILFPSPGGHLAAAEAAAARAAASGWGSSLMEGYAYALSSPPYGVSLPLVEIQRLFEVLWEGLVGSYDPAEVTVYAWSTDAWDWFAPGRKWWGSFLWTVEPPGGRPWIGIAASTTD